MPDPHPHPHPHPGPSSPPVPRKLDLRKDRHLRIEWADGAQSVFPLPYLRQMCPCAACKMLREGSDPHQLMRPATPGELDESERAPEPKKSLSLSVLPKNFTSEEDAPIVTSAELVGNYALRLHWSDGHESGIYSFAYLREIAS